MACRSACLPWRWPPNFSVGRRELTYLELARLEGDPGCGDSADPGADIGRDLFRLVAKAHATGRDPETELRAASHRYRDLVRAWERS